MKKFVIAFLVLVTVSSALGDMNMMFLGSSEDLKEEISLLYSDLRADDDANAWGIYGFCVCNADRSKVFFARGTFYSNRIKGDFYLRNFYLVQKRRLIFLFKQTARNAVRRECGGCTETLSFKVLCYPYY